MTTNTNKSSDRIQYRGLCAACGCQQAVVRGGLAQHGYRRPWDGSGNVGSCAGTGHQPNEVSPDLAKLVSSSLERDRALFEQKLAEVPSLTSVTLFGTYKVTVVEKATAMPWQWDDAVRSEKHKFENALYHIRKAQERVAALLADWQPRALTEVVIEAKASKGEVTSEEIANAKPVKGWPGVSWIDRGRGSWVVVADGRVCGTGRGNMKKNLAVVSASRWLKEKAKTQG